MQLFGYVSNDLTTYSNKKIVVVCEECGKYRVVVKRDYRDLCRSCASKRRKRLPHTEEAKKKMSEAKMGENNSFFGKHHLPNTLPPRGGENNGMYGKKHTEKSKQLMSAKLQNVLIEDWKGYSNKNRYCNMWTEEVRERVRNMFDGLCFICGKDENTNGRKMSVHHVDNDRNQGCNGVQWKLVPLCNSCHGKIGHDPDPWNRLITNVLQYIDDDSCKIDKEDL